MGHRSSRTAPEHFQDEDTHSAWGSDIDETFCGPGKICADEWTPLNSLPPSPEETRRRFSVFSIDNTDQVITEQPTFTDEDITYNGSNYDAMTIIHDDVDTATPILVAPVLPRSMKRKKRRKKIMQRKKRAKSGRTNPSVVSHNRRQSTTESQSIYTRHHPNRRAIRVRRIIVRHDPRYPMIPPPAHISKLKFRKCHPDDTFRYAKAIPPNHLKGMSVPPKPHFRYRGVRKVIG